MKSVWTIIALVVSLSCVAQDTSEIEALGKETVMAEVVIRNGLDVNKFLQRVKNDTTFYKAFRTLRILGFTSLNDIRMLDKNGKVKAGQQAADLTITPGYKFKIIDGLLTNFHLPQSSLLVLVSTFAGHELIMNSYAHAVASRYRFYSYGDCMLIL